VEREQSSSDEERREKPNPNSKKKKKKNKKEKMFSKVSSVFDHFKKPADPKDLVRKWQSELRSEQRGLERQIRDLGREEKLAQKNVSSKRGD
jgi:hypothetical protein